MSDFKMEVDEGESSSRHDSKDERSLASLLGGQSATSLDARPVIPVTALWAKKSRTKTDGRASRKDEVEQMLEEILNPAKVKTALQFNKACEAFLDKAPKTDVGLSSMPLSASLILNSIVDRCSDKKYKQFWPKKSLLRVVEECNVAASSCPSFVLLAIEMKDLEIVQCCIDHMQDIPDSLLTKCLQFYLRHFQGASDRGENSTKGEQPSTAAVCPLSSACAQCINKVLRCPFNDTFIIDNLRQLSFDEALVLLKYLHFLLSTTPASVTDDSTPTLTVVADWISALLDAHFTQLILSHEARALLAQLAESVQTQELFYTELEAVKTILQSFKDSVSVPVKQTSGSYSIEILTM